MKPRSHPKGLSEPIRRALFAASLCGVTGFASAQTVSEEDSEAVIELSPFTVDASTETGYYASQTLAGGRIRTDLKDTGTSVEVLTKKMLEDLGANNVQEFLQYTTGGEVGGSNGNLVGGSSIQDGQISTASARQNPSQNARLRGVGRPDYVRNYFKTSIPMDGYNSDRVDINRGANSFLFGLGSPAGLINTSYARADFRNSNQIDFQVDSGGDSPSTRFSMNLNRELIEDRLALRVATLNNRKRYRQEPTYNDDDRFYAAITVKPFKDAGPTIRAHVEDGFIKGNTPEVLLPVQAFDSFVQMRKPVDVFYNIQRFGHPEGPTKAAWDQLSAADQQRFTYQNQGGANLLDHADNFGYSLVYDGANGDDPSFAFQPIMTSGSYQNDNPFFNPAVITHGDPSPVPGMVTNGAPQLLFWRNQRYTAERDSLGNSQGFTSLDGFDFSKQFFGGDTDFHQREFENYNVALEQLFWGGKAGIELSYDWEDVSREAVTHFDGYRGEFLVDINRTLILPKLDGNGDFLRDGSGNVVSEVRDNPNFGRPWYLSETGNNINYNEKEAYRATAFVNHDFGRSDNGLVKWLGNHTVTVLGDKFTEKFRTNNNQLQTFADDFNIAYHIGSGQGDTPSSGYRRAYKMVYLGPAIQSYISDPFNPNTPLSVNDIILNPSSANLTAGETSVPLTYWNLGPDAEAGRLPDGSTPLPGDNDYVNGNEGWANGTIDARTTPTGNQNTRKTIVESYAINTQSKFFKDHLVVNAGYREDVVQNWLNTVAPTIGDLDPSLPSTDPSHNIFVTDPSVFDYNDGLYTEIDKGPTGEGSFGYGGVLHLPRNLGIAKMPEGFDLSVHYNYSKNFVPDASRNTVVPGPTATFQTLASPIGEGKDYGFTVNMFNNKLVARLNWYETDVKNGDSGLGNILNGLVDWTIRSRKFAEVKINQFDPDGDGMDEHPVHDVSRAYDVVAATQWVEDDGWLGLKEELGFVTYRGNGAVQRTVWFPGLVDTQDIAAKGFEANLTYNPNRNWRMSFNLAKTNSVSSNVAPIMTDVMGKFFDKYNSIKDYHMWNMTLPTATNPNIARWIGPRVISFYQQKLQEGASTNEVREWRANFVTNYDFYEGRLKGWSVGGAIRWQSSGAVGYPLTDFAINDTTTLRVPDVSSPWDGDDLLNVDVNVGYKRKIFNDRVNWSVRLYLRNVNNLDSDNLSTVYANFDGTPGRVRWDPPFEVMLRNSFRF
ncbi:MAG: hypothetical protein SynsKO_30510 [Synoicihabitans sp.]